MRTCLLLLFTSVTIVLSGPIAHAQEVLQGTVTKIEKIIPIIDEVETTYRVMRAEHPPVIDGDPAEWQDIPAIVLDEKAHSSGAWDGPDDLSGSLRMLWDEEALYFCLQVTDDVHRAPNRNSAWRENDCTQFLFDPYMNGPKGSYDLDELNYCVADSPDGPVMASYRVRDTRSEREALAREQDVKMMLGRDGVRVYEWAMPWSRLAPVSPWIFGRCGFAFCINDNDGHGSGGGLFWTRAILWGQDASLFGQIVFDGAAGLRNAMLGLRPEVKVFGDEVGSSWLDLESVDPFGTARLLVSAATALSVKARLTVYRAGQQEALATGCIEHRMRAGESVVFAWDVSGLEDGSYEAVYEVPSIQREPDARLTFYQFDIPDLNARKNELRQRFGIDRPWDDMAESPPLIRRHRGMVAAMLGWLEPEHSLRGIPNRDNAGEHLMAVRDAAEMIAALDAGEDYLGKQRNEFWSAYYSAVDGSGQHFVTAVPSDFDPERTYPLVVNLHGRGWRFLPHRGHEHNAKYLEVEPWARGDNEYRALGENDVLSVIDYMKRWYKIDPDRVYLTGCSMGGSGAWAVASRHPELFAATAPVCGRTSQLPLEDLRHVPLFNQHGAKDWVVLVDQSRFAIDFLQKMGYAVLYKEFPEAGHGVPGQYPALDWMLKLRRPSSPTSITYTCETPDRGKAYWLNLRRFVDPHLSARVDARVTGRGERQSVSLLTQNVSALDMDVLAMPIERQAGLIVQVNKTFLEFSAPLPERLFVVLQEDGWSLSERWSPPASTMRPYRAGAAGNLYSGEPLMIVYGSKGDEARTELLKATSRDISHFAGTGFPMLAGTVRVKADVDVGAEDIEHFNLILLGSANENAIVRRIIDRLPIQINEKNELVAGSRSPVSLDGAGIRMCYYNPLAPQRLIFLVFTDEKGEDAEKWLKSAKRRLTGSDGYNLVDQPDLVVQSVTGAERRRMQFTHDWQWREAEGSDKPLPEKMATEREMALARLRVMRRTAHTDFALTWGSDKEKEEFDPRWFTLADMSTWRSPQQMLIGGVSGRLLTKIYEKLVVNNKATMYPSFEPSELDSDNIYRLAMPPTFTQAIVRFQQTLSNTEAGPDWRAEELWEEVFKK